MNETASLSEKASLWYRKIMQGLQTIEFIYVQPASQKALAQLIVYKG